MVVRWPGHIKPGTVTKEMFAALDWLPTFVDLAGGPKGDDLKKQIEAGKYPGIVKTTLDGFDQADFISGKTDKSNRDHFFYYSGAQLAAVRWKQYKFMYYGSEPGAEGWMLPLIPYHFTMLINLERDPFEQSMGSKSFNSFGGALAGPVTSYIYDWNILPIGQKLALQHLETYETYPPMQAPASWNLSQVLEQINAQKQDHTTRAAGAGD